MTGFPVRNRDHFRRVENKNFKSKTSVTGHGFLTRWTTYNNLSIVFKRFVRKRQCLMIKFLIFY